jgi:hypothetical protein
MKTLITTATDVRLPEEFWTALPNRTATELSATLQQADDYLPEALDAVRAELRRRNLPDQRLALTEPVSSGDTEDDSRRANEPIDWRVGLLIFICSMTLVLLPGVLVFTTARYRRNGCKKMESDSLVCCAWGGASGLVGFAIRGQLGGQ